MDIEKKENVKKILLRIWFGVSTVLSLIFIVFIIIACVNGGNNKVASAECESTEIVNIQADKKLVSYDDENYTITLSAYELNNYVFTNLAEVSSDLTAGQFSYNSNVFAYDEDDGDTRTWVYNLYAIVFNYTEGIFYLNLAQPDYVSFEHDLIIDFGNSDNSPYYSSVKTAIELDIQANQVEEFVPSIFTAMTNSIVGFIGSLSVGITAMVGVFYANNQLTIIGLLSVIVVAISLAYFLFRLIIGLIRMRG